MKKLLLSTMFVLLAVQGICQMSAALQAYTKARMKSVNFTNYTVGFLYGDSATAPLRVYVFDPMSDATPNDSTVIIPNSEPTLGRWILWEYEGMPKTYVGTTDGSGEYTVVFNEPYDEIPTVSAGLRNQATNQFVRVSEVDEEGFTVHVFQRNSVNLLGVDVLLSTTANISGATVDVIVIEN